MLFAGAGRARRSWRRRRPIRDGRAAGKAESDCPAASATLAARLAPLAQGRNRRASASQRARAARSHIAFQRADGGEADARRFQGPRRSCSTCGRPGACRAAPKCRRSTGLQAARRRARISRWWRSTSTPRGSKSAPTFLDEHRRQEPRPATPIPAATRSRRCAWPARRSGLPTSLLIDKDGCEIGAVEGGAKWDSAEAQALVEALKGG